MSAKPVKTPILDALRKDFGVQVAHVMNEGSMAIYAIDCTPEIADFFLTLNDENRPVRRSAVLRYAADMAARRWRFTAEPMHFTREGKACNLQHRCMALVESKTTIRTLIVEGVDEDAIDLIDDGIRRSTADRLHRHGVPRSTVVAKALNAIRMSHGDRRRISFFEMFDFYRDYENAFNYLLRAIPDGHSYLRPQGLGGTAYGAFAYIYRARPSFAASFVRDIQRYSQLPGGHPAVAVGAMLDNVEHLENSNATRVDVFSKICRGAELALKKQNIRHLHASTDAIAFFKAETGDKAAA